MLTFVYPPHGGGHMPLGVGVGRCVVDPYWTVGIWVVGVAALIWSVVYFRILDIF